MERIAEISAHQVISFNRLTTTPKLLGNPQALSSPEQKAAIKREELEDPNHRNRSYLSSDSFSRLFLYLFIQVLKQGRVRKSTDLQFTTKNVYHHHRSGGLGSDYFLSPQESQRYLAAGSNKQINPSSSQKH